MIDQVAPIDTVVNSIDRSAENRTPNRCLLFDGIGAWHPGIVASSGADVWGPATLCSPQTSPRLGSPVRFVIYRDIVDY